MVRFTAKGEKSRQRILTASIRLFAKHGLTGVSVDEIVETAGVNKRMVYHYFGSKEALYQSALEEEYRKLEALEIKTLHPEEPIDRVISDIVSAYFSFLQDSPDFVQLILQENLNQGLNLEKMEVPLSKSPMLDLLVQAVNAGKKNGTVQKHVDARFLLISLIGTCMIYCSNRFTLSRALGMDLSSPKVLNRAKKAVIEILLYGIKA